MWIDQRGSEILSEPECLRLLALATKKGSVGHVAHSGSPGGPPIIQPVNFAYHDHEVIVCLGEGHMAEALPGSLVAFEVDSVEAESSVAWSVLVRGLATAHEGDESEVLEQFRPTLLVPRPGNRLFTIRADVLTGRRFKLSTG